MPKKSKKNVKNIFFCLKQISKCDTFSRAFQKYSFQICSFSHKNVVGYFRFFFYTLQTFYRPVPYPMRQKKKKINKKILKITIYEKSKNYTVIVTKMRVLGQKTRGGGGRQAPKAPPPAFIGLNYLLYKYNAIKLSAFYHFSFQQLIYGELTGKQCSPPPLGLKIEFVVQVRGELPLSCHPDQFFLNLIKHILP